jgi:hypothetical protein
MESRRPQHDGGGIDKNHVVTAPVGVDDRSPHPAHVYDSDTEARPPIGPRVRWGGVMSGFVVAMGTILLLTALGVAIGITTLNDPRATTEYVDSGLGVGASVWGAITLLLACFLGGMVSTRVTDRPDRGGAFIHGTLVWTLVTVFLIWLLGQGISFGLSSLFGALGGLTRTAGTAVTSAVTGDVDLAQRLGLKDPSQVISRLDDPKVISVFASATGMSTNEAQTALNELRTQVEAVRDNPDRVATEVRNFLGQYADRAQQQARQVAATVQEGATVGAWITFGILGAAFIVAMLGALAGIPSLSSWRSRWARTGVA